MKWRYDDIELVWLQGKNVVVSVWFNIFIHHHQYSQFHVEQSHYTYNDVIRLDSYVVRD
jgi:hypothetical protein